MAVVRAQPERPHQRRFHRHPVLRFGWRGQPARKALRLQAAVETWRADRFP